MDEIHERPEENIDPTQPASDNGQPAEAPVETLDLQAEYDRLKAEAAANLDGWQRARAEFANYKKRNETERKQLVFLTGVRIIEKLLPVIDDFDRALANLPEELKGNGWVDGVLLTRRKLISLLEEEGVKPIPVAPGDTFNPTVHEAVTYEESDQFSAGQVIAELQKGYAVEERILRPALVRVAR